MIVRCDSTKAMHNGNKVAAIKVVRTLTNLGLKEAKDLVEATHFDLNIQEGYLREPFPTVEIAIERLQELGVGVEDYGPGGAVANTTICMLEDALHEAVSLKSYDIAEDILALIKKWRK